MGEGNQQQSQNQAIERMFLEAYDSYADQLFRHILIRVRDRELAKDILQEAFSRTWLYLSERKEIGHMRAFLYRVAHNLIIDGARKKRPVSLDSMLEEDGFEPADESVQSPEIRPQTREALKLLRSLDEMYRTAITMRFIDELSPGEIAKALGVSENVVSVRIHRGIERLQKMMNASPKQV